MPTCRNCGNPSTFDVTLLITTQYTNRELGPPRLHADLQCRACDSTHVTGDPFELLR